MLKIPNNWRSIVEEMGESELRLRKIVEVAEMMEKWIKTKIRSQRGLFNFNPNSFDPMIEEQESLFDSTRFMMIEETKNKKNEAKEKIMVPPPPPIQAMSKEVLEKKIDIPERLETKEELELLNLRLNIIQCVMNSGMTI